MELVETVVYKASSGDTNTVRRVVAKVELEEISSRNSVTWEGVNMRVPELPPSRKAGTCLGTGLMDVNYTLEFHVHPGRWWLRPGRWKVAVVIPIIIGKNRPCKLISGLVNLDTTGTIPLQQNLSTPATPPPSYSSKFSEAHRSINFNSLSSQAVS